MLTVRTILKASPIHGIGLFADEDLPAGTTVWRYDGFTDQVLTFRRLKSLLGTLDSFGTDHLVSATYKRNDRYFYITSNARFINHSETGANLALFDDFTELTTRRIDRGEELLENYYECYDTDDFFVIEQRRLDLEHYLSLNRQRRIAYARSTDISGPVGDPRNWPVRCTADPQGDPDLVLPSRN